MPDERMDRGTLAKFAGLAVGIMVGGTTGPILFHGRPNDPGAAALGSAIGAVVGYAVVAALLTVQKRRRDRELARAAEAVIREAKLPESVKVKIANAHATLEGEVDGYPARREAERVISTIPGIKGITNRIRLRSTAEVANPDDIKRRIQESLVRSAEQDGRRIDVFVDRSRVILAGTVRSWVEASEAEQVAWNIPGIAEVENRLDVA